MNECLKSNQVACDRMDRFFAPEGEFSDSTVTLLSQACDRGKALACYYLGVSHCNGQKSQDELEAKTALALFEKACGLKLSAGCQVAGWALAHGAPQANLPQDWERGTALLSKACKLKNATACAGLAKLYYMADRASAESAEVPTPNAQRAAELGRKACALGNDRGYGCLAVGLLYYEGRLGAKDPEQARPYFQKACDLRSANGCASLGQILYEVDKNYVEALKAYTKSCALGGDSMTCQNQQALERFLGARAKG